MLRIGFQGDVQNCHTVIIRDWTRRGDETLLPAIKNACAFVEEAVSLVPREVLLAHGDPRQIVARAAQDHLRHRPHPHGLPRYSGVLFAGPRVYCGIAIAGQDPYCRGGLAALNEELLEQKVALNDVLVLDQEVVIPDSPQIGRLSQVDLELDVEVTGIRRSDRLPSHPVLEGVKAYRAFMEQLGIQRGPLRDEAAEVPVEVFLIDARIREARLIDASPTSRTRQPVATLPLRPPRTLDTSLLQEVEPEPAAAPSEPVAPSEAVSPEPAAPLSEPFGPEVAGLRLGMTFEEAERIVGEHMSVGRTLVADRAWHPTAAAGEIEAYSSGRLFESVDGKELIVLHDEPPAAPGIVVGIVRQLTLREGVITPAQVHAQLEQRYGPATATRSEHLVWIEGGSEADAQQAHCEPDPRATADLRIWRVPEGGGQPTSLRSMRYQTHMPGLGALNLSSTEGCPTVLTAIFDTSHSVTWDRLVLRLVDHGRYRELFQASKDMIARKEGEAEMPEPTEPTVDLRL